MASTQAEIAAPAGADGFDFLMGDWKIRHQRLKTRLAGSDEWLEFDGRVSARKILDGLGNVDENVINLPGGPYHAISLRLFDPKTTQWSIHWVDGRKSQIDPPVVGRFVGGRGLFFGDDFHEGRQVRVRFMWSEITPVSARWEQAFSVDGEKTWETNWVMNFSRV